MIDHSSHLRSFPLFLVEKPKETAPELKNATELKETNAYWEEEINRLASYYRYSGASNVHCLILVKYAYEIKSAPGYSLLRDAVYNTEDQLLKCEPSQRIKNDMALPLLLAINKSISKEDMHQILYKSDIELGMQYIGNSITKKSNKMVGITSYLANTPTEQNNGEYKNDLNTLKKLGEYFETMGINKETLSAQVVSKVSTHELLYVKSFKVYNERRTLAIQKNENKSVSYDTGKELELELQEDTKGERKLLIRKHKLNVGLPEGQTYNDPDGKPIFWESSREERVNQIIQEDLTIEGGFNNINLKNAEKIAEALKSLKEKNKKEFFPKALITRKVENENKYETLYVGEDCRLKDLFPKIETVNEKRENNSIGREKNTITIIAGDSKFSNINKDGVYSGPKIQKSDTLIIHDTVHFTHTLTCKSIIICPKNQVDITVLGDLDVEEIKEEIDYYNSESKPHLVVKGKITTSEVNAPFLTILSDGYDGNDKEDIFYGNTLFHKYKSENNVKFNGNTQIIEISAKNIKSLEDINSSKVVAKMNIIGMKNAYINDYIFANNVLNITQNIEVANERKIMSRDPNDWNKNKEYLFHTEIEPKYCEAREFAVSSKSHIFAKQIIVPHRSMIDQLDKSKTINKMQTQNNSNEISI